MPGRLPIAVCSALAVFVAAAWSGVGPAVPRASAATDPGAVPDASLDAQIHAEQLALVSFNGRHRVELASAAQQSAVAALSAAMGRQAHDRAAAATAAGEAAADAGAVRHDGSAVAAERGAVAEDRAAATSAEEALTDLATAWYTGAVGDTPGSTVGGALPGLAAAQARVQLDGELDAITTGIQVEAVDARARLAAEQRRLTAAVAALAAARDAAGRAAASDRAETVVLAGDRLTVATDRQRVAAADAALAAATREESLALTAFEGPQDPQPAAAPTVLGKAALDGAQLAAWFAQSGYASRVATPIAQLAGWYVSEGAAADVRGDIAFAQAVLETDGFSSLDAVADNNYAGIAHCDSCGSGVRLPSAQLGVRAQIQLLRTFADPTVTSATLGEPPVLPGLAPERVGVRGCCRTWNALTGVWATDPLYGHSILLLYQSMLAYALIADAVSGIDLAGPAGAGP